MCGGVVSCGALLTCSGLMCSDVGKTSGYEGRSKTRSSASSCCWVKASALRCFRKLSTLPWESLFGPEPSEPSTRRESNNRDTDPGKLAFTSSYMHFIFSSCVFFFSPVPPLRGDLRRTERDGVQVFFFPHLNGCSEPLATSHRLFPCTPHHSSNTIMIWEPSGNWWITITCKYIHVVASMYTNESSSEPIIVPFFFFIPARVIFFFLYSFLFFFPLSLLPKKTRPVQFKTQEHFFFFFFLKHNFPFFTIQYRFHSRRVCDSIWRTRGWIKSYSLVQSSCSPNTGIFSRLLTWLPRRLGKKDALAFPVVTCVQRFKAFTDHPTIPPSFFFFFLFPSFFSITHPHTSSPGCTGCVCRSPPRIPESFSSLANLSF